MSTFPGAGGASCGVVSRARGTVKGMTTSAVVLRWCATCLDETMFEQPECHDQHGGECPEWVCVSCGEALLLGFVPPERVHRRRRAARAVGHRVVA